MPTNVDPADVIQGSIFLLGLGHAHQEAACTRSTDDACRDGEAEVEEAPHNGQTAEHHTHSPFLHVRSGQVGSDRVGSGQVESGQVRSGRVRSGQLRSGQVRYTKYVAARINV